MSDVVFMVPSPSGWLAFDREELARALARGADLMPVNTGMAGSMTTAMTTDPDAPALLSSAQMESATGIRRTWFERQARERRIPFRKLGRYTRFVLAEVLACDAFRRQAIPPGGTALNCAGLHDRASTKK
jgi:hypothetical protein